MIQTKVHASTKLIQQATTAVTVGLVLVLNKLKRIATWRKN